MKKYLLLATTSLLVSSSAWAHHPTKDQYNLTIENHKFTPEKLDVPADTPFKLIVQNNDDTAEEFEMNSPKMEKVIPPKSAAVLKFSPIKAGEYKFVGEYHEDTAKGVLNAIAHEEPDATAAPKTAK